MASNDRSTCQIILGDDGPLPAHHCLMEHRVTVDYMADVQGCTLVFHPLGDCNVATSQRPSYRRHAVLIGMIQVAELSRSHL